MAGQLTRMVSLQLADWFTPLEELSGEVAPSPLAWEVTRDAGGLAGEGYRQTRPAGIACLIGSPAVRCLAQAPRDDRAQPPLHVLVGDPHMVVRQGDRTEVNRAPALSPRASRCRERLASRERHDR